MSEVIVAEVKPIKVYKKCDRCGGVMESNGVVTRSIPALYNHICNNCGKSEYYEREYPYCEMIPIEEFREPTGEERRILDK